MRAHHFMESDYNEDLRSEIITLLTAVSAEGVDEIDTQNLLNDLEAQGYAIDQQSLMDMLGELDVVSMATGDKITIATSDADVMVGQDAKDVEQDQVDNMATKQATKDLGEAEMNGQFEHGDDVIDDQGRTGEVHGSVKNGKVQVDFYNSGREIIDVDRLSYNDYANSDEEEHDMRRAMGDDDYDRMHGDLGYNDDDGDSYYESVNRMRKLAGLCEQEKPYDPAEQFKDIGDAELMAMKNYGLGKQREHARAEIERRKNQPWRWDTGKRK